MTGTPGTPTPTWAEVYAEHGPAMRRTARRLVGEDREVLGKSADDIVNDVLVGLIAKGPPPTHGNLRGYLLRAVINRARDQFRRQRFESPNQEAIALQLADDDTALLAERRVLAAIAVGLLDDLTPGQRCAIEQRVMLGRPAHEVAAELGVESPRIAQLCNAGMKRIRKHPAFAEAASADSRRGKTEADGTRT